jgi:hypothetical protein
MRIKAASLDRPYVPSLLFYTPCIIPGSRFSGSVEGEKTGDGTNSNTCNGPRKLHSHKRFLNLDARPMASFVFLPRALCIFI